MKQPILILLLAVFVVALPLSGCQDETPPPKPVELSASDKALAEQLKQERKAREEGRGR